MNAMFNTSTVKIRRKELFETFLLNCLKHSLKQKLQNTERTINNIKILFILFLNTTNMK